MDKEVFDEVTEEIHDKLVDILIEVDNKVGTNGYAYNKLEDAITEVDSALSAAYNVLFQDDNDSVEDDE